LIGIYCQESKTLFAEHIPNLLQNLLRAYNDTYGKVIEATQSALAAVTAAIPKDDSSKSYISVINDTLETSTVTEHLPGFNIPNVRNLQIPLKSSKPNFANINHSSHRDCNHYCHSIKTHCWLELKKKGNKQQLA